MKSGDIVALRSPAEILATLDEDGCLDGMPFMPEMLRYFGRTYTVSVQVRRACDTLGYTGVRNIPGTVLLDDLRCDGSGHAGCGAQCRIYWREAWLRAAPNGDPPPAPPRDDAFEELALRAARSASAPHSTPELPRYRCQATELLRASEPVPWWSVRSLVGEVTSGNVGVWRFVRVACRIVVEEIARRLGLLSALPFKRETMSASPTPTPSNNLRTGQLVQIRAGSEIGPTLNEHGKNRGLWFDREMKVYCGQTARVKAKVERFIDERTGELVELASDCYILDGVVCQSHRSDGRWLCPRAIYPWWREAWLRPIGDEELASR